MRRIRATLIRYSAMICAGSYLGALLTVLLGVRPSKAELIVMLSGGVILGWVAHTQAGMIRTLAIALGRHARGRIPPEQIPEQRAAHPAYRDWR